MNNKEIIVVSDGSTDSTLAVAQQFESRQVNVISQGNQGGNAARNKAFDYAQGDYVQRLGADDLLAPNKIGSHMKATDGDPNSVILCSSPHRTFYWRVEMARMVLNAPWQDLAPLERTMTALTGKLWLYRAGWLTIRRIVEKAGPWDARLCLERRWRILLWGCRVQ